MKFKAKQKTVKPARVFPKIGEIREKSKFATFPKKINDQWIWWEKYLSIQKFTELTHTEEVEVSSGLIEDVLNVTGLVNSRTRLKTSVYNTWQEIDRKIISVI